MRGLEAALGILRLMLEEEEGWVARSLPVLLSLRCGVVV